MGPSKKKRPFKQKNFKQKQKPAKGGTDSVYIDFDALPAELDEEQYADLLENLPRTRRKTKPKAVEHSELIAMNLAELHDVA